MPRASSRHHDRVEDPEVGLACVKQCPDPEVLEIGETEGDALTRFKRLFIPSVGPFETLAWCQAQIGSNQLESVRARVRTSAGAERFCPCSMMSRSRSAASSGSWVS